MGGTSSTNADSIDNFAKTTKNENFGLVNFSSAHLGGINYLEIVTFVIVVLVALYFLKTTCAKHRKKRMQEMSSHLQGLALSESPPAYPVAQPVVPRVAARAPPTYPGDIYNI